MYRDGWGPKAIQRKLDSMGNLFGWSTIKDVIKKYQRGQIGYAHPDQEPIPAFKGVSDNDIVEIQNEFLNSCTQSSTDIQRKLACKGTHVSTTTVKKAIKVAGFTASKPRYGQMVRDVNKEKRVEFCQQLLSTDESFNDIIWTDECTIQLHDNKVVVYRPVNSIAHTIPKPKHPLKIHVWGGISRRGATNILLFDGILRKEFFVENILKNTLLPFIKSTFPDGHRFQQDNDPKHKSKLAQSFMEDNGINWWNIWPSESCDLNPIEMLWHKLKRYLSKQETTMKAELVRHTLEFWSNLSPETCNTYIDHVYKVVPVVILMGGRATGDVPKKLCSESSRGRSIQYFAQQLQKECQQKKFGLLLKDMDGN